MAQIYFWESLNLMYLILNRCCWIWVRATSQEVLVWYKSLTKSDLVISENVWTRTTDIHASLT